MNKTLAKKYLSAINSMKKRCLTSEMLSRRMGIYPEIINEQLSLFEPMLAMDTSYNLKDLVPAIEEYIALQTTKKVKKKPTKVKRKADKYKTVSEFVYEKMTIGGLVDKNASLNEEDLKVLRKLVNEELDSFKKK